MAKGLLPKKDRFVFILGAVVICFVVLITIVITQRGADDVDMVNVDALNTLTSDEATKLAWKERKA